MPLNYAILPESGRGNGANNSLPAPILTIDGGQRLAHDTLSNPINGPCEIYICSDEDCWIDASKVEADIDPSTSPLKLIAGSPQIFSLLQGSWKIKSLAA